MPRKSKGGLLKPKKEGAPPLFDGLGRSEASPLPKLPAVPYFVLLSDLHAHPWAAFAKGDGSQNTRLRASLRIMEASLDMARQLEVPWVFAGDIVHTAGYSLNVVLSEIASLLNLERYKQVAKLAVWGNHDARGVGGQITLEQTVFRSLMLADKNLVVLDPNVTPVYVDQRTGLSFSGAGYQPRKQFLEYGVAADVGVYHQTVRDSKTAGGYALREGIPGEELMERHGIVVVGHVHHWQYHDAGKKAGPGKVLLIPGSPEHQDFGHAGTHGWWVIGKEEEVLLPGGSPEFRTVDTPDQVIPGDGHFYRVRTAPKGTELPSGALAVAPAPMAIEHRDLLSSVHSPSDTVDVWLAQHAPEAPLSRERFAEAGRLLLQEQDVGVLRSVRLTHLILKNFCSYAEQEFEVHPGTWLVVGQGRDYPSNGAGKSSMFEAVRWLLFGTTTKGLSGDEVIRWGTDECVVSATLVDGDGKWLCITRSRGKASKLEVEHEVSGPMEAKSVNEMTEKLGKYLGLTPDLHQALGYFSQEKLLLFASATDGERKDMLADLVGLVMYQEAASRALKKCQDCETVTGQLTAMAEAAEKRAQQERDRLVAEQEQGAAWALDRAERERVANEHVAAEESRYSELIAEAQETLLTELGASHKRRLLALQQRLEKLVAEKTGPTPYVRTEEELAQARAAFTKALGEVTRCRTALEESQRQLQNFKKNLAGQEKQLAQGICPTCRQEITEEHREQCLAPTQADILSVEARIRELEKSQQESVNAAADSKCVVNDITRGVEGAAQLVRWEREEASLRAEAAEIAQAQQEAIAAAYHQAKALVDNILKGKRKAAALIAAEVDPFAKSAEGMRLRIKEVLGELAALRDRRTKAQEELAIHDYWRRGFSKQGIQSLLVDEVAALFNDARGTIFPALTQGVYDAQFSTVSQTRSGESRERTEFQVFEHGQPVQYGALSGGQRRRIDVGVMLTLVKAVSQWMQVPGVLGMLVLDEVCGFLDAAGAEGLMEAIREVQVQIPTIFVVTHDTQLQALFPEVIVVQQDVEGVSRILSQGETT